jgi:hypothetical protein
MARQAGKGGQGASKYLTRSILLTWFGLLLVIVVVGAGTWTILQHPSGGIRPGATPTAGTQVNGTPITVGGPVSPLLFGTNLSLFDSNDQVLNSTATLSLLQRIHPGIIRMPFRGSLSNAVEMRAAQLIKSTGAAPLIVLHGPDDQNTLASDIQIVQNIRPCWRKA